jgi:hypothetical protein
MTFHPYYRLMIDRDFDRETGAPYWTAHCNRCSLTFDYDTEEEALAFMDDHNCEDEDE